VKPPRPPPNAAPQPGAVGKSAWLVQVASEPAPESQASTATMLVNVDPTGVPIESQHGAWKRVTKAEREAATKEARRMDARHAAGRDMCTATPPSSRAPSAARAENNTKRGTRKQEIEEARRRLQELEDKEAARKRKKMQQKAQCEKELADRLAEEKQRELQRQAEQQETARREHEQRVAERRERKQQKSVAKETRKRKDLAKFQCDVNNMVKSADADARDDNRKREEAELVSSQRTKRARRDREGRSPAPSTPSVLSTPALARAP
jgi:hypothetical protein